MWLELSSWVTLAGQAPGGTDGRAGLPPPVDPLGIHICCCSRHCQRWQLPGQQTLNPLEGELGAPQHTEKKHGPVYCTARPSDTFLCGLFRESVTILSFPGGEGVCDQSSYSRGVRGCPQAWGTGPPPRLPRFSLCLFPRGGTGWGF